MNCMINNFEYRIIEVEQHEFVKDSPDQLQMGQTDNVRQTIKILKTLGYKRKRAILNHELTHAFADVFGFNNMAYTSELIPSFNEVCLDNIRDITDDYFYYVYGIEACHCRREY